LRKDSYLMALTSATCYKLKKRNEGNSLAEELAKFQGKDGSVSDQETTITRSGGVAKVIETTGIAVLTWLNDPKFYGQVSKAIEYLSSQCKGGLFSSTQATVLALKAIVAYDATRAAPLKEGSVIARLNGTDIQFLSFDSTSTGTLEMPSFADTIKAGKFDLEIEMLGGSSMPCTYSIEFTTKTGASSERCVLYFGVKMTSDKIVEGEGMEMEVTLVNKTNAGQPMTVAILGIPGGLEFRHAKLQELVKSKTVDYYETNGRFLTCYWRCLAPSDKKAFKVDLIAAVPGTYTAPSSRAYLYYTDEDKMWVTGPTVTVMAKI